MIIENNVKINPNWIKVSIVLKNCSARRSVTNKYTKILKPNEISAKVSNPTEKPKRINDLFLTPFRLQFLHKYPYITLSPYAFDFVPLIKLEVGKWRLHSKHAFSLLMGIQETLEKAFEEYYGKNRWQ